MCQLADVAIKMAWPPFAVDIGGTHVKECLETKGRTMKVRPANHETPGSHAPGEGSRRFSPPVFFPRSGEIEAVEVHHLVPGGHEVVHEALSGVLRSVHFRDRAELNSRWMPSRVSSTDANRAGWLTSQSFCGARRMRAPFAPSRRSEPRKVDADAQAVETSWETESPDARIPAFSAAMSCSSIG